MRKHSQLDSKTILLLLGMFVFLAGTFLERTFDFRDYARRRVYFTNSSGERVRGILSWPTSSSGSLPAMVSLHYLLQVDEAVEPLTREFVRHGFCVLTVEFEGRSPGTGRPRRFEDYCLDAGAAVDFLRGMPGVDPTRIVLLGHSAGANIAVQIASRDPGIPCTVALGYPAGASRERPRNLLWVMGLFDELHPLVEVEEAVAPSGEKKVFPRVDYGKERKARIFTVAPLSDHPLEIFDPVFWSESILGINGWIGREPEAKVTQHFWLLGRALSFLGLVLLAIASGLLLLEKTLRRLEGYPLTLRLRISGILWSLFLGIALFCWRLLGGRFLSDLIAAEFLALLVCNRLFRDGWDSSSVPVLLRRFLLYFFLFWGVYIVAVMANRIENLLRYPGYVAWIPVFMAYAPGADLFLVSARLKSFLLDFTTNSARIWLPLFLAGEIFSPGIVLRSAGALIRQCLGFLRRASLKVSLKSSRGALITLGVAAACAVLSWHQILGEGYYFDRQAVMGFALLFLRLMVLPAMLVALILRSRTFKRLEEIASGPPNPPRIDQGV